MADKPRGVAAPDSVIADKPPGVAAPNSVITDKPLGVGVPDEIEADPRPYVTSAAPGRPLLASRGYKTTYMPANAARSLVLRTWRQGGVGDRSQQPVGHRRGSRQGTGCRGCGCLATYLRLPAPPEASLEPREAHYRALSAQPADHVVAAIRASGGRVEAWEVDLAEPSAIPELMDRAERAFGPVEESSCTAPAVCEPDTFLPAQALGADSRAADGVPLRTIAAESHDRHFAVDGHATALLMAELARRHIARGG